MKSAPALLAQTNVDPALAAGPAPAPLNPSRSHLTRLMAVWRSAGWPCRDALEIDLLAAGWLQSHTGGDGREVLRLTNAGLHLLATARQRQRRAASAHDQLAQRMARELALAGRLVWLELSLRARVQAPMPATTSGSTSAPSTAPAATDDAAPSPAAQHALALDPVHEPPPAATGPAAVWRLARPDVFSVRHTSVPAYLHPVVHEVKVNRADLLSDLRHAAKREAYQWLCSECYYVFPAGLAAPNEIPAAFGIWVLHGPIDSGRLELLRPARHTPCELPFAVWMALAKATPLGAAAHELSEPGGLDVLNGPAEPTGPSQGLLGDESPALA